MCIELRKSRRQIEKSNESLVLMNQWKQFINQESLIMLTQKLHMISRFVKFCHMDNPFISKIGQVKKWKIPTCVLQNGN